MCSPAATASGGRAWTSEAATIGSRATSVGTGVSSRRRRAQAGSACLGMLIPPSVLMIVWGVLTELSIGKLFLEDETHFLDSAATRLRAAPGSTVILR